MAKKYFTVGRAQMKLPEIKTSLLKLQNLKKVLDSILSVRLDQNEIGQEESIEITIKLNKEYRKISYEFYKETGKLEKTGCVLKDLEQGLVDFYCKFEKRDIFLCWKLGEDKIKAWHETDSGFSGRKSTIGLEQ